MQIHQLKIKSRKPKRRIGRGGKKGTYSGRGVKGQKSRSGANINPIFEGGRSTLIEHLPKLRGFKSIHPQNQIIGLDKINKIFDEGAVVSPQALREKRIIRKIKVPVKILGNGEITKKITFEKCLVSKSAKEKIEKAGGIVKN
ncbi:MAG: 50S ribosomal protein L15 [Candidatus Moranbacteria bacterium GW2011_GWC1_45_18]|nr:MAG: 50S ribosomal protein L15 [Candidatus Moranbacteria bacterium GW2011_GWC2_40_12]KKT33884.1 MAG: 50S ribosomal protein L15 [Candidatus Moranbacteria bacterium GW2011_GWF2_44_10]KKT99784.1 MAG: 50S ribosomal protein L15 [Candidatus Moranbacteria bacterium GW2011_GWC1_45_18]OGI34966.1 MAG: 50S ribosomal protein L15 [Candidatus Moranbacteria bacterium RIFOXYC1_FULL_44_8]OGI39526.1 MAG: 50S ribosomal protein L15 [Candidatus Moranbacteria bacterium RIFOXYB1_FULL_44_23]OGI43208.1 MAG: 50S rib